MAKTKDKSSHIKLSLIKSSKEKRKWLTYFDMNFLAVTAIGLPIGVLIVFSRNEVLGVSYWPVVFLPIVGVLFSLFINSTAQLGPKKTRTLDLILAALLSISITLLEAPWRDIYTADSFWPHMWGMSLGGAIAGTLFSLFSILSLKLEKRGVLEPLIDSAAFFMPIVMIVSGAIFANIFSIFSLFIWTKEVAQLGPEFLPSSVFITLVTAFLFILLGQILSWLKHTQIGDD